MARRKPRPQRHSLGSGPSSGTSVGCCGRTEGGARTGRATVGGCGYQPAGAVPQQTPWNVLGSTPNQNEEGGGGGAAVCSSTKAHTARLLPLAQAANPGGWPPPKSPLNPVPNVGRLCAAPCIFFHPGPRDNPLCATTDSSIRPRRRRHGGHVDRAPSLIALASSLMFERKGSLATFHAPHHHRRWLSSSWTPLSQ